MNHWARRSQVSLGAILLWWSGTASGQDTYLARWEAINRRQPAALSLRISAPKSEFYLGELIPLQLSFSSTEPRGFVANTRLQDRVGRLNGVEEFLVDPADLVEDPLRGLPGEDGGMGGLSSGPVLLSQKPFSFERLLNDWVRFRKPGRYRVAILTRRVTQIADDPARSDSYLQMHATGTPLELMSNILTLTIAPAPAAWVKGQVAESVKILDGPMDPSEETRQRRLRAARTLRFLDSQEAAVELAGHMGSGEDVDSWSLHMGVLGSAYRKQLLPVLEARLIAPEQHVWDRYLDTLSRLSELLASAGPMSPFPKDQALQVAWRSESQRRDQLRHAKRQEYVARLIASLPGKQPEARAISMNTLLDSARNDGTAQWLPALTASLIADFRHLPSRMQSNLLEGRWNVIRSPALVPVLRDLYAHPPEPRVDPPLQDTAVRRLYELAPDEGRRIILSQIAQPDTYLSLTTLSMLPDRSLPELNDRMAARLEAGQYVDSLILRYATGDIVERVEKAYEKRNQELERQKLPHCGGPLIYYFLQHDPPYGERGLRSALEKPAGAPACYDIGFQFQTLGRHAYSAALERLAIEFLASPKVPVKRGAAEVLGKYGSAAAQKPLWDTFEYFRSWWKGREAELDDSIGQESLQLERALRIALAQADAWVLEPDGLNRLLDLCTSNWCKQEVKGWLSQAANPVVIGAMAGPGEFRVTFAQYEARSAEQLRRKIQQFPAGTAFRLAPFPGGDTPARRELEEIFRSAGFSLVPL